jgi:hypothetical protein
MLAGELLNSLIRNELLSLFEENRVKTVTMASHTLNTTKHTKRQKVVCPEHLRQPR